MTLEQMERHDIDQLRFALERREHIGPEAGRRIPLPRDPLTNIALCIEELGAGGQVPEAVVDQATVGVGDVRPAAPGSVATKQRVHDRLGRIEPDLGLAVVLQARRA